MGAYGTPEHLPDENEESEYQYGYGNYDGSQYTDPQCRYKKRGLKGWQIVLITLAVTFLCFYIVGSYEINTGKVQITANQNHKISTRYNAAASHDLAPSPSVGFSISKATYDKVKEGMTYEAVKKLFGSAGKQTAETEEKDDKYFSADYEWSNENGSICIMMFFVNDKLDTKSEYGLE